MLLDPNYNHVLSIDIETLSKTMMHISLLQYLAAVVGLTLHLVQEWVHMWGVGF